MKALLGNIQHEDTEPLQLVRYDGGERFRLHQDWINPTKAETFNPEYPIRPYNRLVSSFIYLEDNCTGGETYFPEVTGVGPEADGSKFSRTESGKGLLVKPRRGNAVLWKTLHMNGTGDSRLLHASLPVRSGRKTGMNLFSLFYVDAPMIGGTTTS
jgi:prolyl 4-hydroxylase